MKTTELPLTERQKQALETRDRIRKAAFLLFEKKGFENVSMQEIARAAGCSAGNLYHYYKNKEALILQFTDHVDAVYDRLVKQIPKSYGPLKRLEWFVLHAIIESNEEDAIAMGFAHALKNPELHTLDPLTDRPYYRYLEQMIDACIRKGLITDEYTTEDVIRMILILQRGLLFHWRVEQGRFDITQMATRLVHGLIGQIRA